MKFLRNSGFVIALLMLSYVSNGQSGGCFEIKSILVDACGSPEGENEMVLFEIGSAQLNVSNMVVDWPNNPWNGLCQDASTATLTTSINQLIQGCGSVTEPVGGVLPANSKVLLITSTNVDINSNSFSNLNDDLIVLYQCAGNTSGHFANYNTLPGLRTLTIQFTGSGGCTDEVTYDRTLLINQFGTIGGFSFDNNGAFVDFDASGNATYLNYGCQVLSTSVNLNGGPDIGICPGASGPVTLNGSAVGLVGSPTWQGGSGLFNPAGSLSTIYTPGPADTGLVVLTVTGNGACNIMVTDTVLLNVVTSLPVITLSLSVDGVFSSSFSDPGYFYNWFEVGDSTAIPFQFNPTYIPNNNGCYYMVLTTIGGCTTTSDTVCITNVGVNEPLQYESLSIFNNPGSSPSLKFTNKAAGEYNIEILDTFGRIISGYKQFLQEGEVGITPDWNNVSNGIYILRCINETQSIRVKLMRTAE